MAHMDNSIFYFLRDMQSILVVMFRCCRGNFAIIT